MEWFILCLGVYISGMLAVGVWGHDNTNDDEVKECDKIAFRNMDIVLWPIAIVAITLDSCYGHTLRQARAIVLHRRKRKNVKKDTPYCQ